MKRRESIDRSELWRSPDTDHLELRQLLDAIERLESRGNRNVEDPQLRQTPQRSQIAGGWTGELKAFQRCDAPTCSSSASPSALATTRRRRGRAARLASPRVLAEICTASASVGTSSIDLTSGGEGAPDSSSRRSISKIPVRILMLAFGSFRSPHSGKAVTDEYPSHGRRGQRGTARAGCLYAAILHRRIDVEFRRKRALRAGYGPNA